MSNPTVNDDSKAELRKLLKSAKTLLKMENCLEESDLGEECLIVADKFLTEYGKKHIDQVFLFGKRALDILSDNTNPNKNCLISRALVLVLLGSVYLHMNKYDESLSYLNRAEMTLGSLEWDSFDTSILIQETLCMLKKAMFKTSESIVHVINILDIKTKMMDEDCVEFGEANKNVCKAYIEAYDHKSALPYCLKALEIYTKCLGPDSVEVAQLTRYLSLIYSDSGEHVKAYEHNQLAQYILLKKDPNSPDLLVAHMDASFMLIDLGRYQEAIDVLNAVLQRTDIGETDRARLYIDMARVLCHLKKFTDAKKYMKTVKRILDKKEMHPMLAIVGFADLSQMYEMMMDFENAISLIKESLAVPELPQKLLLLLSNKLFRLMSISGKEKMELPYMEGVLRRLEESFGSEHHHVGKARAQLGIIYRNSGQKELAVKSMEKAKEVLDASLGSHHLSSLKTSHKLSVTLAGLERFHQALEIEQKILEGFIDLTPNEVSFMNKVVDHVGNLKNMVAISPTTASSQSKGLWSFLCEKIQNVAFKN